MNMAEIATTAHRASQDPWELSMLLDLLNHTVRPRLVLEIGSWYGGTLFAWASTGAQVVAVTGWETREYLEQGHTYGAEMIYGNSHDDEMRERIPAALAGRKIDFAFIDGDHSEEGCRQDFELCAWLGVPVIGFHDITGIGDPGVRRVWDDLASRFPHMVLIRPQPKACGTGVIWTGAVA